ncbi:HNH endonuclease signature motif containing protein [Paenibacillus daejeonensis]|uniref:HNH endonuclease signature motif containing protein n=1 Tax=Paenibacillus daejeonensis TaxID=135193 RepID=UPI00036E3A81|nr:HNH endonuclease signature motif containing protein [Paenibacillus daejeonensis]
MFRFSPEQRDFIKTHIKGRTVPELTIIFNKHFGTELKQSQMRAFKTNNRLTNGVDSTFKKGSVPANKGKKGMTTGGVATQFKKGNKPHNYKPVGSERVNGDDYVDIKIADPNKWRGKHLILWEKHNERPVPKGHAVIFGDGDRRNFAPGNLLLVSRSQLAILNKKGLIQGSAELTKTGIIMADIYSKIGQRRNKRKS